MILSRFRDVPSFRLAVQCSPWALCLIALGCSEDAPLPNSGTGGQQSTGGATTGGTTGAGGAVGSGGGNMLSGGTTSSGGANTGGNSTGGSNSGGTNSGGTNSGGGVATGGDTSSGGSSGKPPAEPSAGCGQANPDIGTSSNPLNVANHRYYVKLPTGYDPDTPYPVLFMFHPTGNPITWAEQNAGYEKNSAKDEAIRVYPEAGNVSSGWGASDVPLFVPLYEKVTGDYCVDKERVFATGESSGGDFVSILGCEHGDLVRGVGPCATKPVNQYPLNAGSRSCVGNVTAIVIHGSMDNQVGPENGPATRDFYTQVNDCSNMSEPVEGYTDSMSNCVHFQGCREGADVYWCLHNDPEYGGTNHGWPKFAGNMTWEVFREL